MLMVSPLSYGTPPVQHVWTYAAGLSGDRNQCHPSNCPCNTVLPVYGQDSVNHHMLAAATTVSLDQLTRHSADGTPVIPCGMVCSVEEVRYLVVTILDCPGLTRTHPPLPLPLSTCVSVLMRSLTMRTLVLSVWSFLSNKYCP